MAAWSGGGPGKLDEWGFCWVRGARAKVKKKAWGFNPRNKTYQGLRQAHTQHNLPRRIYRSEHIPRPKF